jgi:hypothetical protein
MTVRGGQRDGEYNYIIRCPTFGDVVTILTERSMQDVTVERSPVIFHGHGHYK